MLIENVKSTLIQHKAENVSVHRDVHYTGEIYIVASCTSHRHSKALAQHVMQDLKDSNMQCYVEGLREGNWILIEIGDIFVHLFVDAVRTYYDVDNLWQRSTL